MLMKSIFFTAMTLLTTHSHAVLQPEIQSLKACYIETGLKEDSFENIFLLNTLYISSKFGVISKDLLMDTAKASQSCDQQTKNLISLMGQKEFVKSLQHQSEVATQKIGQIVLKTTGRTCNSNPFLWADLKGQKDYNESLAEILDENGFLRKGAHGLLEMAGSYYLSLALMRIEIANNNEVQALSTKKRKMLTCSQLEDAIFKVLTVYGEASPVKSANSNSENREQILKELADSLIN